MSTRTYAMVAAAPCTQVSHVKQVKKYATARAVYSVRFSRNFFTEAPDVVHGMFESLLDDYFYCPISSQRYFKKYQLEIIVECITMLVSRVSTQACDEFERKIRTWSARADLVYYRAEKIMANAKRKKAKRDAQYALDTRDYRNCDDPDSRYICGLMKKVVEFIDSMDADEFYDEYDMSYRIISIAKTSLSAMHLLTKDTWTNLDKKEYNKLCTELAELFATI
jgi:hypothetical protein